MDNALLIFSIKDRDYFGISNQFVAECFISFEDIGKADPTEQIHLMLSRPNTTGLFFVAIFNIFLGKKNCKPIYNKLCSDLLTDCGYLNAIKLREGDKMAREFIKKLKQKLPTL